MDKSVRVRTLFEIKGGGKRERIKKEPRDTDDPIGASS